MLHFFQDEETTQTGAGGKVFNPEAYCEICQVSPAILCRRRSDPCHPPRPQFHAIFEISISFTGREKSTRTEELVREKRLDRSACVRRPVVTNGHVGVRPNALVEFSMRQDSFMRSSSWTSGGSGGGCGMWRRTTCSFLRIEEGILP